MSINLYTESIISDPIDYKDFKKTIGFLPPYAVALWLDTHTSFIKQHLEDSIQSWSFQKEIKTLFIDNFSYFAPIKSNTMICIALGGRGKDGWFPPKFKWITEEETTRYPIYEGVRFATLEMIEKIKNESYGDLDYEDLSAIFSLINTSLIPWEQKNDGCDGRAKLCYQILLSMCIEANKIYKVYCFGDHLGEKIECDWSHHVAIALCDRKNALWLMDPAMSPDEPLQEALWIEKCQPFSQKKIERKNIKDLPLKITGDKVTLLKVRGDENIELENEMALVQDNAHAYHLEMICSHKIQHTINENRLLFQPFTHYVQSNGWHEIKPLKQEEHAQAVDNLAAFLAGSTLIPPPEDINNILPSEFLSQNINNLKQIPESLTPKLISIKVSREVKSAKITLKKEIEKLNQFIIKVQQTHLSSDQINALQEAVDNKKREFEQAEREFMQTAQKVTPIKDEH